VKAHFCCAAPSSLCVVIAADGLIRTQALWSAEARLPDWMGSLHRSSRLSPAKAGGCSAKQLSFTSPSCPVSDGGSLNERYNVLTRTLLCCQMGGRGGRRISGSVTAAGGGSTDISQP
jgi:hypothetical protein